MKAFMIGATVLVLSSCGQSMTQGNPSNQLPAKTEAIANNAPSTPMPMVATSTDSERMQPHAEQIVVSSGAVEKKDYTKTLSASPRHQEWIEVDNNGKKIQTWVVYPQKSDKSKVVLLIHENRGLNDWVRNLADQVASEGYIAVAPDLLSGFSDTYKRTTDFPTEDAAIKALGSLDPKLVTEDIQAVAKYAKTISAANGQIVAAWFCWGGSQAFKFATASNDITAALVFYGSAPTNPEEFKNITVPVYGFYGSNDERINSTLPKTIEYMSAAQKKFEPITYSGAGHAFMRLGEDMNPLTSNQQARWEAWERMKTILRAE